MVQWLECISIVANSILMKKYEAIKIIFIRVDSLTRETFVLEIILWRCLKAGVKIFSDSTENLLSGENNVLFTVWNQKWTSLKIITRSQLALMLTRI